MPPHRLTDFEIQKYYQNEPRFNEVYSRNNLPRKIKDGAQVINLDNMQMQVHTGLLYFKKEVKFVHFDSFGVEHVPEEINKFIRHKS